MNPEPHAALSLDPMVHTPARLAILLVLSAVEEADFRFLLHATGLTKGNLSAHLSKLEEAGYVEIEKTFRGKLPLTLCRITPEGRQALENYRNTIQQVLNTPISTPSSGGDHDPSH